MYKNYFVLDLSKLTVKQSELYFFGHLHLDSPATHFEILTPYPELLTPILKAYELKGTLEITATYFDSKSTYLYSNSVDKAYFRAFQSICFLNQQLQITEFKPEKHNQDNRIIIPKNSQQMHFVQRQQFIVSRFGPIQENNCLAANFYGAMFPVKKLSALSDKISQAFEILEHSDLVGLYLCLQLQKYKAQVHSAAGFKTIESFEYSNKVYKSFTSKDPASLSLCMWPTIKQTARKNLLTIFGKTSLPKAEILHNLYASV